MAKIFSILFASQWLQFIPKMNRLKQDFMKQNLKNCWYHNYKSWFSFLKKKLYRTVIFVLISCYNLQLSNLKKLNRFIKFLYNRKQVYHCENTRCKCSSSEEHFVTRRTFDLPNFLQICMSPNSSQLIHHLWKEIVWHWIITNALWGLNIE